MDRRAAHARPGLRAAGSERGSADHRAGDRRGAIDHYGAPSETIVDRRRVRPARDRRGAGMRSRPDPITTEVIGHHLTSIAEEMKRTVIRTAMNPIIYEVLDFSTGVFDAR